MFDVGFSEILLTSAIALIVLGPEKLPKVARQVGNWMGRARAMARQLTEQLEREVSAEELLKQTTKSKPSSTSSSVTSDPSPFDTSAYVPPPVMAPIEAVAPPPAEAPPPAGSHGVSAPAAGEPELGLPSDVYSSHVGATPQGADWHPAPPESKSGNG